ncbi:hypothetical protein ACGFNU_50035 [Spirillospora sp. NPDC048911]|uniref:hypothetical protein n=1 Tax=Spirillospora sp. NPDC048911 TaxID=3364527 RepID=UPI0037118DD6
MVTRCGRLLGRAFKLAFGLVRASPTMARPRARCSIAVNCVRTGASSGPDPMLLAKVSR